MSRDELAARIRVKQEAREQQQEESVNSVEAAKRKLANLTNSISLGKQVESPRAMADPPPYQQQHQLATSVVEPITARNQEILKQLMVSSSNAQPTMAQAVPQQHQGAPQALNIASLAQGAILRHIQQSNHSQQQMQVPQQQTQHIQQQAQQQQRQMQVVQQQQQQQQPGMTPSPQLQQLVRLHAPPAAAAAVQHPTMARGQMQMQVAGPASPPVLHIPEGFNQNFNNQVAASYANTVQTVRYAGYSYFSHTPPPPMLTNTIIAHYGIWPVGAYLRPICIPTYPC